MKHILLVTTLLFLSLFFIQSAHAEVLFDTTTLTKTSSPTTFSVNSANPDTFYLDVSNYKTIATTTLPVYCTSSSGRTLTINIYDLSSSATTSLWNGTYTATAAGNQNYVFNPNLTFDTTIKNRILLFRIYISNAIYPLYLTGLSNASTSKQFLYSTEDYNYQLTSTTAFYYYPIKLEGTMRDVSNYQCTDISGCSSLGNTDCYDIDGCMSEDDCAICEDCNDIGYACQPYFSDSFGLITSCAETYASGTDDVSNVEYRYYHIPALIITLILVIVAFFFSRVIIEIIKRFK